MKYILKIKKMAVNICFASLLGAIPQFALTQTNQSEITRVQFEEDFLHKAIHSVLEYLQQVYKGKDNFFNLDNEVPYEEHIKNFKESLVLIKKIHVYVHKEWKNSDNHTNNEYTEKLKTLNTMVKSLHIIQEKWVQAVDKNRNILSLSGALYEMQGVATKIKNQISQALVPALENHMSDHALVNEVEEIKRLVGLIFASMDTTQGLKYLRHRLKY